MEYEEKVGVLSHRHSFLASTLAASLAKAGEIRAKTKLLTDTYLDMRIIALQGLLANVEKIKPYKAYCILKELSALSTEGDVEMLLVESEEVDDED